MFVVYSLDYYSDHPPMSAVRRLLEMMPGAAKFSYVPLVYFIYNVELWIQWHFYFEGRTLSYSSQTAVSVLDQLITKLIRSISFFPHFVLFFQFLFVETLYRPVERMVDGKFKCTLTVSGCGTFVATGRNFRIAKSTAAQKALRALQQMESETKT